MLTDAEVDRRFTICVRELKSDASATDWPPVNQPAEPRSPREGTEGPSVTSTRVLAAVVAVVVFAIGIVGVQALGLGVLGIVLWVTVVVPGVTLATLLLVDRFHGRRA